MSRWKSCQWCATPWDLSHLPKATAILARLSLAEFNIADLPYRITEEEEAEPMIAQKKR